MLARGALMKNKILWQFICGVLGASLNNSLVTAVEHSGYFPLIESNGQVIIAASLTFESYGLEPQNIEQVRAASADSIKDESGRFPEELIEKENASIKEANLLGVTSLYDEHSKLAVENQFSNINRIAIERRAATLSFIQKQYFEEFMAISYLINTEKYGKVPWIDVVGKKNDNNYALTMDLPRSGFVTTVFSAALSHEKGNLKPLSEKMTPGKDASDPKIIKTFDLITVGLDSGTRTFTYKELTDVTQDANTKKVPMTIGIRANIFKHPFDATVDQPTDSYTKVINSACKLSQKQGKLTIPFSDENGDLQPSRKARGIPVTLEDAQRIVGYLDADFGRIYFCESEQRVDKFIFLLKGSEGASPIIVANPFGENSSLFKLFLYDDGFKKCLSLIAQEAKR
jgi:hypothetical protein